MDVFGLLTLTVAIFFLVLGLTQSGDPDKGFGSPYILTLLAISALAFVVFVLGELRLQNPMVDPRILANASYSAAAVVAFTLSAGLFSLFFFLTLFLQNSLGFSPLQAGLRFLPLSGLVLVTALLAGAFTSRVGARPVMFVGMAVLVVAVLLMTRVGPSDTQSDWLVLPPAFQQYTHSPLFAQFQQIAHATFINGLTDILRVAVVILVVGMLVTLFVKKSDMINTTGEEAAPA